MNKLKPFVIPLLVLAGSGALAAWLATSRPEAVTKPPEETVYPVSLMTLNAGDITPAISVFGQVQAARVAEIRAMVEGRLMTMSEAFRSGSRVASGTELATIDPADYQIRVNELLAELDRSRSQVGELEQELKWERELVKNAERQVELAERALARSEALAKKGRESKKVRDDTEVALATAEQSLLLRQQTIARLSAKLTQQRAQFEAQQARLAEAERDLAQTRVVAPFDGYLADVTPALGQVIGVGETLGRLLSLDELEVRFDLADADFARLMAGSDSHQALIGRQASINWRLGGESQSFKATVKRVGAEIDPALGGIELIADIEAGAATRGLRAGAFVEIRFADITYTNAYRIPVRAVINNTTSFVMREGRLVEVPVAVQRRLGRDLIVKAEYRADEQLVERVFAGIGPGLRVRPLGQ